MGIKYAEEEGVCGGVWRSGWKNRLPYSGGLISSGVTSKKFKTNSLSDIFGGNLTSACFRYEGTGESDR